MKKKLFKESPKWEIIFNRKSYITDCGIIISFECGLYEPPSKTTLMPLVRPLALDSMANICYKEILFTIVYIKYLT